MSRFADLSQTKTIHGPCRCDGKPHPEDTVEILTELPYGAEGAMGAAGWARSDKVFDFVAARLKLLELAVVSWNFLGPNGTPWEPSQTTVALLDKQTANWIATEINAAVTAKGKGSLPNGSGGSSRNGSSETRSRTPAKPTPASSTTSS
jgi:hypothetical protein